MVTEHTPIATDPSASAAADPLAGVNGQMAEALQIAQAAAAGAIPAPGKKDKLPPGVRVQVALMNAAGNNCPCTPCRVLRAEAAALADLVVAELDADAGS